MLSLCTFHDDDRDDIYKIYIFVFILTVFKWLIREGYELHLFSIFAQYATMYHSCSELCIMTKTAPFMSWLCHKHRLWGESITSTWRAQVIIAPMVPAHVAHTITNGHGLAPKPFNSLSSVLKHAHNIFAGCFDRRWCHTYIPISKTRLNCVVFVVFYFQHVRQFIGLDFCLLSPSNACHDNIDIYNCYVIFIGYYWHLLNSMRYFSRRNYLLKLGLGRCFWFSVIFVNESDNMK